MPNERNFPEINDPNARVEINTDENGVPFEQVVTYVDENSDQPEKQEIYHYAENGNLIMDVLHLVNGYGESVDISQVERHYDEAGNLKVTTWDPREFDENGNLLEYDDNFSIETEKFTYEYDENNQEIMSEYVDINGDIKTVERTYNEDGQEINTKSYFNGDLQYDTDRIYDDKGQEVEVRIHNGELSQYSEEKVLQNLIIKEYDENGNLIKETNEQKLVFSVAGPFHTNVKEYDENGNIEKDETTLRDLDGNLLEVDRYEGDTLVDAEKYNAEGNLEYSFHDNTNAQTRETIYYDKDGNEIDRTSYSYADEEKDNVEEDPYDDIDEDYEEDYDDIDDDYEEDYDDIDDDYYDDPIE